MRDKERWLSFQKATVALALDLDISITKAERMIFDALETGVSARIYTIGIAREVPSEWWAGAEVGGWDIRLPDGTVTNRDEIDVNAYDLSDLVEEVKGPPSLTGRTSDAQIRKEIAAVYDEADASNQKPPNIVELADQVQPRLEAKGHTASKGQIKKIGGEGAFKVRRRLPGKTLRSER